MSPEREAWVEEELRLQRIAARVPLRALHRPALVAGVAAVLTVLVVGVRLLMPPAYLATILFRVEEGELSSPGEGPQPPRDLGEHISRVALSRVQLEQIMRKHGISSTWLKGDRVGAVAGFREDVSIEVTRDWFIYDRQPGDPPRSAHVAISLKGPDPEATRAVLRDIGEAILRAQRSERRGDVAQTFEALRIQRDANREQARGLRDIIAGLMVESGNARPTVAVVLRSRVAALEEQLRGILANEAEIERRAASLRFGAAIESQNLAFRFDSFDERLTILTPRLGPFRAARLAAITFLAVLVLVGVVIGAFDDHIYEPEDLALRRIPVFGALPRFAGDTAASYRERVRPRPRVPARVGP